MATATESNNKEVVLSQPLCVQSLRQPIDYLIAYILLATYKVQPATPMCCSLEKLCPHSKMWHLKLWTSDGVPMGLGPGFLHGQPSIPACPQPWPQAQPEPIPQGGRPCVPREECAAGHRLPAGHSHGKKRLAPGHCWPLLTSMTVLEIVFFHWKNSFPIHFDFHVLRVRGMGARSLWQAL